MQDGKEVGQAGQPFGGKFNKSMDTAITQIKANRYPEVLTDFSGEILLVGINYDKGSKKHTCKIEKVGGRIY